ncbi:HEAT repeat domain-containing protein [Planctomycetota bacterium]
MASNNQFSEIEEELLALARPGAPKKLEGMIWQQRNARGMSAADYESPVVTTPRRRIAAWIFSLAAGFFLLLGGFLFYRNITRPVAEETAVTEQAFETEGMFLFVETREINARRFALLQEMKDFEILEKEEGDKIQDYTVTGIMDNGIEVATADGTNEFLSRDKLQARLDRMLPKELNRLKSQMVKGELSNVGLERIGHWATYGNETAITLLDAVANSSKNRYQARAKELLFGGKQAKALSMLLKILGEKDERYHLDAVHGLGKIHSPHSLNALRKIAFGKQTKLQLAAIQGLGNLRDIQALKPLSDMIKDPGTESALKAAAESAYGRILHNTHPEK